MKENLTIIKREMEKYIKAQMAFIQMKICWMASRVKNMLLIANQTLQKRSKNLKTEIATIQNEAQREKRLKK